MAFGLLLLLWVVFACVFGLIYDAFFSSGATRESEWDSEGRADLEGPNLTPLFLFLELILIVPASCVLLLLWYFDLAP